MACPIIIARERGEAARSGRLQPLSINFLKSLDKMSSLWAVFEVSDGLLDEGAREVMEARVRELIVSETCTTWRSR